MTATRHTTVPSPIGPLLLTADAQDRLTGLYAPDHKGGPTTAPGPRDAGGVLATVTAQLDAYFAGERMRFDVPTHSAGSPLQQRVWASLVVVPYGTTTTYGVVAAGLGLTPGAARAVGAANGRNPISIVVPCHRVVGASGALTGYAGGLAAKRLLLSLEAGAATVALQRAVHVVR